MRATYRAMRVGLALLSVGAVWLTATSAVEAEVYETTGVYDRVDAANDNWVDEEATGNAKSLGLFTADVAAAFAAEQGGVIDFETGITHPSNHSNLYGTAFSATYGAAQAKTVAVTSNKTHYIYHNNTSDQVRTISNPSNYLPQSDQIAYQLNFAPQPGAGPGELVSEVAFTALARSTFAAAGDPVEITAYYSDGSSSTLNHTIGNAKGQHDTFFHFAAPSAETSITGLLLKNNSTAGGQTDNQRRIPIDDLAFVTSSAAPLATFHTVGQYNAAAANNPVDSEAPGNALSLTDFTSHVASAFAAGRGGVIDFETGFPDPGGARNNGLKRNFTAAYGSDLSKLMAVSSDKDLFVWHEDTAGQVDTISDPGNLLPTDDQTEYRLLMAPVAAGTPGEVVTEVGLTVLSRDTFAASGDPVEITAHFSDGTTQTLSDSILGTRAIDDTFYHVTAPHGHGITAIDLANVGLGNPPTANQRRVPIDDLAFVTTRQPTAEQTVVQLGTAAPSYSLAADATETLTGLAEHPDHAPFTMMEDGLLLEFNYDPLVERDITSATLQIDVTDSDGEFLTLTSGEGLFIGQTRNSGDNGSPGPWRTVGDSFNLDHAFAIPLEAYDDLLDGSFTVIGDWDVSGKAFGSNRAILTITSVQVPEPGALLLALVGLVGLWPVVRPRRRREIASR